MQSTATCNNGTNKELEITENFEISVDYRQNNDEYFYGEEAKSPSRITIKKKKKNLSIYVNNSEIKF